MSEYDPKYWTDKGLDPNISSECLSNDQAKLMLELQENMGFNQATGEHWDQARRKDRLKQRDVAQKCLDTLTNYCNVAGDYNLEDILSRIKLPEIPKQANKTVYKKIFEEKVISALKAVDTSDKRIKILKAELLKKY